MFVDRFTMDLLRLKNRLMHPGISLACGKCFKHTECITHVYKKYIIIECCICGYKEKHMEEDQTTI